MKDRDVLVGIYARWMYKRRETRRGRVTGSRQSRAVSYMGRECAILQDVRLVGMYV